MYTLRDDVVRYQGAIELERTLSRKTLTWLRTIAFAGMVIFLLIYLIGGLGTELVPQKISLGLTCLFGALWLHQLMLYAFHNSHYFYGLNSIMGLSEQTINGASYLVAQIVQIDEDDVTASFANHELGREVLVRTGLSTESINRYLNSDRAKISTLDIPLPKDKPFYFIPLGLHIIKHDNSFVEFLTKEGESKENFIGALRWVSDNYSRERHQERWWGKDNLAKTEGIGREWSYGNSYTLLQYSRNINTGAVYSNLTPSDSAFMAEKTAAVEAALAKDRAANVLIIGEAGSGTTDILLEFDKKIKYGKSIHSLSDYQLLQLDTSRIFTNHNQKQDLEITFINLFVEAIEAGNIIIVIENLSSVLKEAESLGVYLPELLDPYLANQNLHIIATDTPGNYHNYLEPLGAFARRFTEILVDSPDLSSTNRVLESVAYNIEGKYGAMFTYGAITAISQDADRYIMEGVMPDKAVELMMEIASTISRTETNLITAELVHSHVSQKTGIPTGAVKEEERDLLLNLEDKLHERVIGQDNALDAIASTIRRSRAGIQSADKPIGSFLFLGPTGVGKTETAKALAYTFFGSEEKLVRLDMSEFSGNDALNRLLGNSDESGILPDLLREHPYCVLLLDEFEKSNQTVHDLFLQILDEGRFTDGRGNLTNARNTIIIATSNAGSKLILNTVSQRKELSTLQSEIINHIIKEGTYRPELINRFDNTIIFEPLSKEELGEVASLLLKNLQSRIKEQGYTLVINKELMDVLIEKGYNPEFGARPMQRAIQDFVEEKVAQKIISGEVSKGSSITLTTKDFSEN